MAEKGPKKMTKSDEFWARAHAHQEALRRLLMKKAAAKAAELTVAQATADKREADKATLFAKLGWRFRIAA